MGSLNEKNHWKYISIKFKYKEIKWHFPGQHAGHWPVCTESHLYIPKLPYKVSSFLLPIHCNFLGSSEGL